MILRLALAALVFALTACRVTVTNEVESATTGASSSGTSSSGGSSGGAVGLLAACGSDAGILGVCEQTLSDPFNCGSCGHVCPNQIPTDVPTTDAWGCSYGTCVPVNASQPDPCVSQILPDGGSGCFPGAELCPVVPESYGAKYAPASDYFFAAGATNSCPCTDTMWDRSNCGGCGITCAAGQTCASGSCVACPAGEVEDLTFPSLQAGVPPSCRPEGEPPEVTFGGYVITSAVCPATGSAGPYWATLSADPTNCGSCGNACANGQLCLAGVCTSPSTAASNGSGVAGTALPDGGVSCPTGLADCPNAAYCPDTQSDPYHCGGCDQVCPTGAPVCEQGHCVTGCPEGQLDAYAPILTGGTSACTPTCPTVFGVQMSACGDPPYCTLLTSDPSNCGSCGNVCPNYQRCWDGECLPACENDRLVCGSVAVFCAFGTTCLVADAGCGQVCEGPIADPICFSTCCAPSCPEGQMCNGQVCVSSCG